MTIRSLIAIFLLAGVGALGGCSPLRVSFDIGFAPAPGLSEREVLKDGGAARNAPKVALIPVNGFLADARSPGLLGAGPNPVDELVQRLELAEKDPNVRAVVLRINSPGGTVTGSDIMYREARAFAERTGKPIVASMGEIATSGGYYLALAADHIIAEPTTVTGSVGVIMQTFNVSAGLAKLGIQARAVKSGPNKDLANPLAPMEDDHYDILQGMIDDYYDRFRGLVVERRSALSDADVEMATDGRVFTGAQALEIGLVDQTGGVREAFDEAKSLAKLTAARLIAYVGPDASPVSPYGVRADQSLKPASATGAHTQINLVQLNLARDLGAIDAGAAFHYLWRP